MWLCGKLSKPLFDFFFRGWQAEMDWQHTISSLYTHSTLGWPYSIDGVSLRNLFLWVAFSYSATGHIMQQSEPIPVEWLTTYLYIIDNK